MPRRAETEPDWPARRRLADLIEAYLAEEIGATDFDEGIWAVEEKTSDQTVLDVVCELWFFYDDLEDHRIVTTKEGWDYLHRLVLVLRSGGHVEAKTDYRWTLRQAVALAAVAGAAVWIGVLGAERPWLVWLCMSLVSMELGGWSRRTESKAPAGVAVATPFSSVAELLAARRRTGSVRKRPYPRHVGRRRIRPARNEAIGWALWIGLSLVVAPVGLLLHLVPDRDTECRVVLPEPDGD